MKIAADVAELRTGAEQAQQHLSNIEGAVKEAGAEFVNFEDRLTRVAERLIEFEALRETFNFVKEVAETTGALEDESVATGIATDELQRMNYVAQNFGATSETMARAVETFSAKLANGDGNATRAVQELGLNVDKLIQSGPEQAFLDFASAADKVSDPMDRAAYFTDVFGGRVGRTLLAMGDLNDAMRSVPDVAIIPPDVIASAHAFDVEIEHLVTDLKAFSAEAGAGTFGGLKNALSSGLSASGSDPIMGFVSGMFSSTVISGFNAALKDTGISLKDVGDQAKDTGGKIRQTGDDAASATDRDKAYENELKALQAAHAALSEKQQQQIATLHDLNDKNDAIAKTLHINIDVVDEYVKQLDEQKRAQKELDAAIKELDGSSGTYRDTVAALDQAQVAAIKNYLDAGVSQHALAIAYDLTASEIKAVAKEMQAEHALAQQANKEQAAELTELTKLWTDYNNLRATHGTTTTDQEIAKVNEWATAVKTAAEKAGIATSQFYDTLATVTNEKMSEVLVDWKAIDDALTNDTQRGLQQTADKAQATFNEILKYSGTVPDSIIQHFRDAADQAQLAVGDFGSTTATTMDTVATKSTTTAHAIASNFKNAFQQVKDAAAPTFSDIQAMLEGLDPLTKAAQDAGIFVNTAAFQNENLRSFGGLTNRSLPHLVGGGVVSKPTVALIGEAGPEAVVPLGAGGGGGGMTVQVIVQGQTIEGPGAAARNGRAAADAFAERLKALGVRLS